MSFLYRVLFIDMAHRQGYVAAATYQVEEPPPTLKEIEYAIEWLDSQPARDRLAEVLAGIIARMGWQWKEIDQLGVGLGPGSFTGIRMSLAFAKGLALAGVVKFRGFCSLLPYFLKSDRASPSETLHQASLQTGEGSSDEHEKRSFLSAFDARAGGVYILDSRTAQSVGPERVSLQEFGRRAQEVDGVVSPDAEQLQRRLDELELRSPLYSPGIDAPVGAWASSEKKRGESRGLQQKVREGEMNFEELVLAWWQEDRAQSGEGKHSLEPIYLESKW